MTNHEGGCADVLVTVRAQVMTRDENAGGWLALDGGGLAIVSVRRRPRLTPITDEAGNIQTHEYIIYGQRISDQSVILSCTINRDLNYFKVMPTFHHWHTGKQRNGLTFQTAADARAFDKGIVQAYRQILSVGEDDVFMAVQLPQETSDAPVKRIESTTTSTTVIDSQSSPGSNGSNNSVKQKLKEKYDKKEGIRYISDEKPATSPLISSSTLDQSEQPASIAPGDNYSYVQLTVPKPVVTPQDLTAVYRDSDNVRPITTTTSSSSPPSSCYSLTSTVAPTNLNRPLSPQTTIIQSIPLPIQVQPLDDIAVLKEHITNPAKQTPATTIAGIPLSTSTRFTGVTTRKRCRHCHNFYAEDFNPKGSCEYAPDLFKSGIETISGLCCARCMMYHCMSDSEGDTPAHPCQCSLESGCAKRWFGLTLLSLFVPCLLCYPPLKACHWVGVSCGLCGGQHKPEV
ncbi:SPRED2 family protein [Megaselia abdita]